MRRCERKFATFFSFHLIDQNQLEIERMFGVAIEVETNFAIKIFFFSATANYLDPWTMRNVSVEITQNTGIIFCYDFLTIV